MTLLGKISRFFTQLLMLLTAPVLLAGLPYCLMGIGILVIYLIMTQIYEHKGSIYPFFGGNSNYSEYGVLSERKVKKEHDIRDKNGMKIGSYETTETEKYYSGSMFQYSRSAPLWKFGIYIICYPFLRIVSLLASIVALFTDKFYVQVSTPAEYYEAPERYNRFLLCYFDIVYKRSDEAVAKYLSKEELREKRAARAARAKDILQKIAICIFPPASVFIFLYSLFGILTTLDNPAKRKQEEYVDTLVVSFCVIVFWVIFAFFYNTIR